MRCEREFWLKTLRCELPENEFEKLILQSYIAGLRRQLGIKPDVDTIRAQTRERVRKHRQRLKAKKSL